jgi:hypothetical protein
VRSSPAGTALIDLIKATAEIPDAGEPGAAEGYDAVTELCLRHVPFACKVAPLVNSKLSPQVRWEYVSSGCALEPAGSLQISVCGMMAQS